MLALDAAEGRFGARTVLSRTSLAVEPGRFAVVVGPNGAGKSTLLKLLTGEIAPARGCARLDGVDLRDFSAKALARRRAVLPQSSTLSFPFTVEEVVRLGLEAGGRRMQPAAIADALAQMDLAGFAEREADRLSGGEQQRVHMARVLCQIGPAESWRAPPFLLLDEPVSSLDIRHQIAVLRQARRLARQGAGVVAVLHDLNLAAAFAERLLVVAGGRVVADGAPGEVVNDALLRDVFGVHLPVGALPPAAVPFVLPQTAV